MARRMSPAATLRQALPGYGADRGLPARASGRARLGGSLALPAQGAGAKSSTAPTVMQASATLNVGKCQSQTAK